MKQALAIGNCQGVKPSDNVPASDSHKSDDRAAPATSADEQESVQSSSRRNGGNG